MKLFLITTCALIALLYGVAAPFLTPTIINHAFDGGLFWSGVGNVLAATIAVAYLYKTRGGSSRLTRFLFGIALVAMATVLYSNFGMVLEHAQRLEGHMPKEQIGNFVGFKLLSTYAKDLVALGFGAIGANLAASSITEQGP